MIMIVSGGGNTIHSHSNLNNEFSKACLNSDFDTIKKILNGSFYFQISTNLKDNEKNFEALIKNGSLDILDYLFNSPNLKKHFYTEKESEHFHSPFIYAAMYGKIEILDYLILKHKIDISNNQVNQALNWACKKAQLKTVSYLLTSETFKDRCNINNNKGDVLISTLHSESLQVLDYILNSPHLKEKSSIAMVGCQDVIYRALYTKSPEILSLVLQSMYEQDILKPEHLTETIKKSIIENKPSFINVLIAFSQKFELELINKNVIQLAGQSSDLKTFLHVLDHYKKTKYKSSSHFEKIKNLISFHLNMKIIEYSKKTFSPAIQSYLSSMEEGKNLLKSSKSRHISKKQIL